MKSWITTALCLVLSCCFCLAAFSMQCPTTAALDVVSTAISHDVYYFPSPVDRLTISYTYDTPDHTTYTSYWVQLDVQTNDSCNGTWMDINDIVWDAEIGAGGCTENGTGNLQREVPVLYHEDCSGADDYRMKIRLVGRDSEPPIEDELASSNWIYVNH